MCANGNAGETLSALSRERGLGPGVSPRPNPTRGAALNHCFMVLSVTAAREQARLIIKGAQCVLSVVRVVVNFRWRWLL